LIHLGRAHPRTHAIADLITLVEEAGAQVSDDLRQAARLTAYAVSARYPGVAEEVTEAEYREAVELSDRVVAWAEALIYSADSAEGDQ
jgi:HEPN domain-containing protein